MIKFGAKFNPIVGLDISTSGVKAVELRPVGSKWRIHRCGFKALPPRAVMDGQVKDSDTVSQSIQELFKETKITTKNVAFSVSGSSVIIKKIQLPVMSELDLEDQIKVEAEEYIPFDISEVNLDFQILEKTADHMEVLLVACKNEMVNNRLEVIKAAGLKPVICDLDLFSIETAYDHLLRKELKDHADTVALINVGATLTNINILTNGMPSFTRDQLFGGAHLTDDIQRFYSISAEDVEQMLTAGEFPEDFQDSLLMPFLDQLSLQIGQSLEFYNGGHANNPVKALYLTGGCALLPGITNYLHERTDLPVSVINPFDYIKAGKGLGEGGEFVNVAPRFMVAVGLALRGAA